MVLESNLMEIAAFQRLSSNSPQIPVTRKTAHVRLSRKTLCINVIQRNHSDSSRFHLHYHRREYRHQGPTEMSQIVLPNPSSNRERVRAILGQRNPRSHLIDRVSTAELLTIIDNEDAGVATFSSHFRNPLNPSPQLFANSRSTLAIGIDYLRMTQNSITRSPAQ